MVECRRIFLAPKTLAKVFSPAVAEATKNETTYIYGALKGEKKTLTAALFLRPRRNLRRRRSLSI